MLSPVVELKNQVLQLRAGLEKYTNTGDLDCDSRDIAGGVIDIDDSTA